MNRHRLKRVTLDGTRLRKGPVLDDLSAALAQSSKGEDTDDDLM